MHFACELLRVKAGSCAKSNQNPQSVLDLEDFTVFQIVVGLPERGGSNIASVAYGHPMGA
ncbi:hypothetical protein FHS30_002564 [Simiduia aestuariiviva]|uniref:Uncharacterized protein n=1 Tax=Simiduia aestuariiviva TaxID=1510459 RepID=A0A839UTR3_9GAMM|nr:hypothetical protein [Simiduia aestuariiviva]